MDYLLVQEQSLKLAQLRKQLMLSMDRAEAGLLPFDYILAAQKDTTP